MLKGLSRLISADSFPESREALEADEKAELNIIAWGDPQISALSPLRSERVYSACMDIKNAAGKFDLLMLLGDNAEYGMKAEYMMLSRLLNSVSSKVESFIVISGNHDVRIRNYKKQLRKFNAFIGDIKGGIIGRAEHYYFKTELKGYKFIMLGADKNAFEASYISKEQLDWLDSELKKAENDKVVFVLNHQPLRYSHGLPATWLGKGEWRGHIGEQSDELKAIFEKYKNVFFITGHLHYGTSKYNYEDYGAYKALSLPTIGVLNHGEYNHDAQGYVIYVYDNKIILRSRLFKQGRFAEKDVENSYVEIEI